MFIYMAHTKFKTSKSLVPTTRHNEIWVRWKSETSLIQCRKEVEL